MNTQTVFKRYEFKYFLNETQLDALMPLINTHMRTDAYGKSSILNLYFDTPNDMLIRHSLEKPVYKEKLRLRSYTVPDADTPVFLEIKKKYKGVVYKRRAGTSYQQMLRYLNEQIPFSDSQIMHEIDYFMQYYPNLTPHVFLSYEREAFHAPACSDLRITFDRNILWRQENLSLAAGIYGTQLLPDNSILMEVKTSGGMPLWLTHFLTEEHLQRRGFSKYGTVYIQTHYPINQTPMEVTL